MVFLHLSPSIGSCGLPELLSVGVSAAQHLCFHFSLKLVLEYLFDGLKYRQAGAANDEAERAQRSIGRVLSEAGSWAKKTYREIRRNDCA